MNFKEYWTQFRNKEIKLITQRFSSGGLQSKETWDTIIQGKIDSIQEYPPGITLKDVTKQVMYEMLYITISGTANKPIIVEAKDPEEKDKLFVSFNSIIELEWL